MIDAKGYWLSVNIRSDNGDDLCDPAANDTKYIVKLHHSDAPIVGVAHKYGDALKEFKAKLQSARRLCPRLTPDLENFQSNSAQNSHDLALVFISESDIEKDLTN
jgi:hypothetical protein